MPRWDIREKDPRHVEASIMGTEQNVEMSDLGRGKGGKWHIIPCLRAMLADFTTYPKAASNKVEKILDNLLNSELDWMMRRIELLALDDLLEYYPSVGSIACAALLLGGK